MALCDLKIETEGLTLNYLKSLEFDQGTLKL